MQLTPKKPGRPARIAPAGRDLAAEQQHLAAWWAIRPGGKPSASEVARRLELSHTYIACFIQQTRPVSVLQLENIQRILTAYGYEPPTDHYKFL